MSRTTTTRILIACFLAALSVGATGCFGGTAGADKNPAREGIAVRLDGLDYNVYMTRQLNVTDPEDKAYYQGPVNDPQCAAGSGIDARTRQQRCPTNLYGVFISVCNVYGGKHQSAAKFEIEDSQGNKYDPLPNPPTNLFQYHPRMLGKRECIPAKGSTADTAPIAGAVFVFRLPVQATENRPLELTVDTGDKVKQFELDI
jgi:hypothetical protein